MAPYFPEFEQNSSRAIGSRYSSVRRVESGRCPSGLPPSPEALFLFTYRKRHRVTHGFKWTLLRRMNSS